MNTKRERPGLAGRLPAAVLLALLGGCQPFKNHLLGDDRGDGAVVSSQQAQGLPGKYSFRSAPYVFLYDFDVKRDQPLFQDLAKLPDQVYKELRLTPGSATVQVYLFENRERYDRFLQARYPDLPRRRAFFIAQPRSIGGVEDLLVYTFWDDDRIQQDLRHELTHALLHSVLKEVPLWLDEGLAEYFELPPENQGVNAAHVDQLRHSSNGLFQPDLARLESLTQVGEMSQREYREAWAWVHLLLRGKPETKAVLISYLQQLRSIPNPGPLGPRLEAVLPKPDEVLNAHLAALESAKDSRAQR